jgi:uncharacterized DUF497 family protein
LIKIQANRKKPNLDLEMVRKVFFEKTSFNLRTENKSEEGVANQRVMAKGRVFDSFKCFFFLVLHPYIYAKFLNIYSFIHIVR